MSTVVETTDLAGRLHIRYHKAARASYRLFETVADELVVSSLMDAPRDVPRFRGYRETRLRWAQLTRIFHSRPEDWMTALSAVSGVYLIVTGDGRQYVGSAYGAQGIWGRWESYIATGGHGGNVALKEVMAQSPNVAQTFQFSILETADTGASSEDILARESHWKRVLGTRAMGLNLN